MNRKVRNLILGALDDSAQSAEDQAVYYDDVPGRTRPQHNKARAADHRRRAKRLLEARYEFILLYQDTYRDTRRGKKR